MSRFLIKADGPDVPGIVAAVTGAIKNQGCNLEDSSMTRLGGSFAMLLIVASSTHLPLEEFSEAFREATTSLNLDISVESLPAMPAGPIVHGDLWAITLTGKDQPGVVSSISHYLAEIGANIDDLSTRIIGATSSSYTALIDVTVPRHIDRQAMLERVNVIAREFGSSCDARLIGHR